MQTRLIMVEGVPFTGKSTTSEFIAQQLALNGYQVQWLSEGMMLQHYFTHVMGTFDHEQPLSEALMWADWDAFVQAVMGEPTIFVVDSALSYTAILPLLDRDRPTETILADLARLAEVCAPLQPRVIHLTGDVDYLTRASIVDRGVAWEEQMIRQAEAAPYQQARGRTGLEGAISIMQDAQALARQIFAGWQTLTVDVTRTDWTMNRQAILDFLDIPAVTIDVPDLSRTVLESYTGTYEAEDPEAISKLLSVHLEQDTLALHAPRNRYGPLVPLSVTRFHLQATPVDIEFVVEEGLAKDLILFRSNGQEHVYHRVNGRTGGP